MPLDPVDRKGECASEEWEEQTSQRQLTGLWLLCPGRGEDGMEEGGVPEALWW